MARELLIIFQKLLHTYWGNQGVAVKRGAEPLLPLFLYYDSVIQDSSIYNDISVLSAWLAEMASVQANIKTVVIASLTHL